MTSSFPATETIAVASFMLSNASTVHEDKLTEGIVDIRFGITLVVNNFLAFYVTGGQKKIKRQGHMIIDNSIDLRLKTVHKFSTDCINCEVL